MRFLKDTRIQAANNTRGVIKTLQPESDKSGLTHVRGLFTAFVQGKMRRKAIRIWVQENGKYVEIKIADYLYIQKLVREIPDVIYDRSIRSGDGIRYGGCVSISREEV